MIDAQALNDILGKALSAGIEACGITTQRGELIAARSINPSYIHSQEFNLLLSVVTNSWLSYKTTDLAINADTNAPDPEALCSLFIEAGEKRLYLLALGSQGIIFIQAGRTVQVGMLKLVASSLQEHLDQPFRDLLEF
jgi:hypothetical protein